MHEAGDRGGEGMQALETEPNLEKQIMQKEP